MLETLKIKDIRTEGDNREIDGNGDLDTLASSIVANGLLNPITVAKSGEGYVVVAGHRRLAAVQSLKWTDIPVNIVEGTEADLLAMRVVENTIRKNLHPMEEALVFQQLKLDHNVDLPDLATLTGKSVSTLARYMKLAAMDPKLQRIFIDRKAPVAVMLEISTYSDYIQEWCVDLVRWDNDEDTEWPQPRYFKESVHRNFMTDLDEAVFDKTVKYEYTPEDGGDPIKIQACVDCPYHTGAQKDLFEEETKDLCTDPECFNRKRTLFQEQIIEAASEKHEELLLATGEGASYNQENTVIQDWRYEKAKKTEEGALPALIIDGKGAGKIKYVKLKDGYSDTTSTSSNADKEARKLQKKRKEIMSELWTKINANIDIDPEATYNLHSMFIKRMFTTASSDTRRRLAAILGFVNPEKVEGLETYLQPTAWDELKKNVKFDDANQWPLLMSALIFADDAYVSQNSSNRICSENVEKLCELWKVDLDEIDPDHDIHAEKEKETDS